MVKKNFEDIYNRLNTIPACDMLRGKKNKTCLPSLRFLGEHNYTLRSPFSMGRPSVVCLSSIVTLLHPIEGWTFRQYFAPSIALSSTLL